MPADYKKFNKTLLAHGKVDPVVYLNLNGLNCLDRSLVMRSKQNTSVKRAAQTAPVSALRFLGLLGFSLIAVLWLAKSTFAADKIITSHGISSFGELKLSLIHI